MIGIKRAIIILILMFQWGCEVEDDSSSSSQVGPGTCEISKSLSAVLCLDYFGTVNTNDANTYCVSTLFPAYQTAISASGYTYQASTTIPIVNPSCSDSNVGKCQITQGELYYFSGEWNATTAQADCTATHSGTWVP